MPFEQALAKQQVLKYFLRFPIYLILYAFLLNRITKSNKIAYVVRMIIWISHLIFAPITILTGVFFASLANLELNASLAYIYGQQ